MLPIMCCVDTMGEVLVDSQKGTWRSLLIRKMPSPWDRPQGFMIHVCPAEFQDFKTSINRLNATK